MSGEDEAQQLISIFVCQKDLDIEHFLKEKAVLFEKLGKSRTFIIYDEEFENIKDFKILAYFTLALQVLKVPGEFSGGKIKNFDGFNAKIHGERITEFPAILIGQVAKNEIYKEIITGFEVMQYCLITLLSGQTYLGGRIVMLECKNISYLIEFYNRFGFDKIEKDYNEDELLQMVKILQEDEIIEKY